MEESMFNQQQNYLILGKKGSAKTALAFTLMQTIVHTQQKKGYIYRHPDNSSLKTIPFKIINIHNLNRLYHLKDAVVLIDEAHIHFSVQEKKVNEELRNILSISRQNNTDFIFVCHNSYFLNRSLFSFIDIKMIKEVNPQHWELERNYMKKLYQSCHIYGKEKFFLDSDFDRGEKSFDKPEWYTEKLSKAYRSQLNKKSFFDKFLKNSTNLHNNAPKCE